ncbi:MAG: serine/threonine-protein kinase [Terrimicrobiaceae bacterium]
MALHAFRLGCNPVEMPMRFQHFEVLTKPDGSPWVLGRSTLGTTYKARDTNLRSDVALKVLALDGDPTLREAFLKDARAAAALRHTNVASIYHLGELDGTCFYAMEFVEGRQLAARLLDTEKIPLTQAVEIALQISRALAAASRQNLLHRDINPSNILLVRDDDGRTIVKMIDFGLARVAPVPDTAGSPDYTSPELLRGGPIDIRSDIYSLGATLFHMLTGHPPVVADPVSITGLDDAPADVRSLVKRMLASDPAARPQTPTALRIELEACLGAATVIPPAAPPPSRPNAPPRSWPVVPIAVAALIGVGVAGWFFWKKSMVTVPVEFAAPVVPPPASPPSPTPAAPTVELVLGPFDSLMAKEHYAEALSLALNAGAEFSSLDLPRQKMEMVAALLRSNAFVMTPAKFQPLRPALEAAAGKDVVSAQVLLGEQLRESEPVTALRWFQAAARNSQTEAMTQTGLMLANGKGVPSPDPALAAQWFEKAAEAGDTDAMTALAECLIHGKGVEKNPERAAGLLHAAIAFDHPLAFNLLGDLYHRGVGVPKDEAEALRLFTRGSELGSGDATANLGLLYLRGEGVPRDPSKAAAIWKTGAERGFAACMLNFAKALASGTGVPANEPEARKWFVEAARAGKPEAIAWCQKNRVPFQ